MRQFGSYLIFFSYNPREEMKNTESRKWELKNELNLRNFEDGARLFERIMNEVWLPQTTQLVPFAFAWRANGVTDLTVFCPGNNKKKNIS